MLLWLYLFKVLEHLYAYSPFAVISELVHHYHMVFLLPLLAIIIVTTDCTHEGITVYNSLKVTFKELRVISRDNVESI